VTTTTRTWHTAFIVEPARLIAAQPAQVGISALSMLFTAIFFAAPLRAVPWLHPWLIFGVAGAAALGVEYAFLKGISDRAFVEAHGGRGVWGDVLVFTTGGLLIVAGATVLLTYAYRLPVFVSPAPWLAFTLALLHIVPLALIGVCSAQLHAAAERVSISEQRETARTFEEKKREIDLKVYAAEQTAMARQRVRANGAQQAPSASGTGAGRGANTSREHLLEQIARTLREQPDANRAELARSLGIGRTTLYALIKEAQARGLLP
jgi:hypothetical protein